MESKFKNMENDLEDEEEPREINSDKENSIKKEK